MQWQSDFAPKKAVAVAVYLEKRKSRVFVGELHYINNEPEPYFEFTYDVRYRYSKTGISLGPDLSLLKSKYRSPVLFETFKDRIPSRENAAYPDYCRSTGISVDEADPIILLSTIGRRGPSAFIFEPVFANVFSHEHLKQYRLNLGLTLREFALMFDMSYSNLQKIEANKHSGKDVLKRVEIYSKFPEVALYEVTISGVRLHDKKRHEVLDFLKKELKSTTTPKTETDK